MVCTLKSLAIIADVAVRDNNMGDNMDLVFILNGGIDDFKVDVWVDKFFLYCKFSDNPVWSGCRCI